MYLKPPKRVGDCFAAIVVETGVKTKCEFEEVTAFDVDDVWARFIVKSSSESSFENIAKLDGECFALVKSWSADNDIEEPCQIRGPVTRISDGDVKMIKVRVPRDGYEFISGKSYSICICMRDMKLCSGKVFVHWRVDEYSEHVPSGDVDASGIEEDNISGVDNKVRDDDTTNDTTNDARNDVVQTNDVADTEASGTLSNDPETYDITKTGCVQITIDSSDPDELLNRTIDHVNGALSRVRQEANEIETYLRDVVSQMSRHVSRI